MSRSTCEATRLSINTKWERETEDILSNMQKMIEDVTFQKNWNETLEDSRLGDKDMLNKIRTEYFGD